MTSIKVFGSPTSTEVARVLACLFEKDVEFELIRTDSFKGAVRRMDYLKRQATGQALTYEEEKDTITEFRHSDSRKIARHISKKYRELGNKDLLGMGTLELASIEQWLQTEEQSFDVPASELVFQLAVIPELGQQQDEKKIEKSKERLVEVLKTYDETLEKSPYLAGDIFTLADLSHLPNTHKLMGTECASLFTARKNVKKWWERISKRPSWRRVVAMQNDQAANVMV